MRYYIETPSGRKGPYDLEQIRESLNAGRLSNDTEVRAEDGGPLLTVLDVLSGRTERREPVRDRNAPQPELNPFAPPMGAPPPISEYPVYQDQGSFGTGFVLGMFCGCIALIWSLASRNAKPETKRGVLVGFAVGVVLGMILRFLSAMSRMH